MRLGHYDPRRPIIKSVLTKSVGFVILTPPPNTSFYFYILRYYYNTKNMLGDFPGYPFQLLEDVFNYNVLGGARMMVWEKDEVVDRVGQSLEHEACRGFPLVLYKIQSKWALHKHKPCSCHSPSIS